MKRALILIIIMCIGFVAHSEARKNKNDYTPDWGVVEPDSLPQKAFYDIPSPQSVALISQTSTRHINNNHREGIDVSHYQGKIDWNKVAREGKISYAYIKCSEGGTIQDEYYRYNMEAARKAHISVGAYHFYRPNIPYDEQLANMTSIAKKADMDLVPIIDIEVRGQDSSDVFFRNLRQFLNAVEKYYGKRPMLYTGQNFYNKHLAGEFKNYAWMIAKYLDEPPLLNDNLNFHFWQYTSKGRVPGIKGNVDRSCLMNAHMLHEISM